MTRRRLSLTGFVIAVISAGYLSVQTSVGAGALPEHLSDKAFWALSNELSEENGYFRSDNLVSNEVWMQYVIADLLKATKPGRVYLGVGPEQNFTYIAAVKPAMVFIVDIRRENLQLHLMYKALFELSKDRAEFVSRLFSKKRPPGLTTKSTVEEIFNAYAEVPTSEALYKDNLKAIQDHLVKTRGLPLSEEDLKGIEYVAYQFYWFGPVITYSSTNPTNGRMRGGNSMPTYYDVMLSTDADNKMLSYLSDEDRFLFLKQLHNRNMLVPVVGNFGGTKALRAVGRYLKEQGATVAAFYLSNVEQYLMQSGLIPAFCSNVAALPLDEQSMFIRSVRGSPPGGSLNGGLRFGGLVNQLGSMLAETRSCPK
jgi:hypothetical protein